MLNNFKQVLDNVDVHPLLNQLHEHPELWRTDNQWSAKPGTVQNGQDSIVLRYNKSPDWNKPAFKILNAAQPIVFDLMRAIPGETLGKVVITRLRPGQNIDPHIDRMPPGIPAYYQRYQIPLSVKPGVVFRCGDEELLMKSGNAYWFNNQLLHDVRNTSDYDRLSMFCDICPFVLENLCP